jgi:Lrp/AsnC family transcriptional regulator, leucine-responsive regulatory protein
MLRRKADMSENYLHAATLGAIMTSVELDAMDGRIINILHTEGRISNLELAERVGLSPTPCSRRLKRLEDTGVISGYGVRINPAILGFGVSAVVTIRLGRQSPADINAFLSAVRSNSEITECLLVTGSLDYVLRIRVRDVDALKTFILTKLKTIECVSETTTMLILETPKSMDAQPLIDDWLDQPRTKGHRRKIRIGTGTSRRPR